MLLQKSVVPVNITKTGNLTAVVYWFVLHLDDIHKLSTGPIAYETVNDICSRKNSVNMLVDVGVVNKSILLFVAELLASSCRCFQK